MSFTIHNLFATSSSSRLLPSLKNPNSSLSLYSQNLLFKPQIPRIILSFTPKTQTFILKAYRTEDLINPQTNHTFDVDGFLSIAELVCIVSSSVIAISYAVNLRVLGSGRVLGWGVLTLIGGVVMGGWIRRRQWRRRESGHMVERVERLEDEMRNLATVVRVLSRQVEKLGIRFRLTRKSLKEPISQTAALAQKNSEATRALAMQEDLLEKELVEIQKVLLAMQEQQQKQLELILAISKSGKLWESRAGNNKEWEAIKKLDPTEGVKQLEIQQTQSSGASVVDNSND